MVRAWHRIWQKAPLYTVVHDAKKIKLFFDKLEIRTSFVQRIPFAKKHLRWYLSLLPAAAESFDLSAYDVVLSSASAFGKGALVPPHAIHICYCHTPTRYLWSDTTSYVRDSSGNWLIKFLLPFFLNKLRIWDQLASARVDYFIANSRFVAERIERYYGRTSTVIYPPVDVHGYPHVKKQDYYVIVSRLRPYKRVDIAIQAFNRLGMRLVVVGDGEELGALRRIAGRNITFTGSIPDANKKQLLAGARGFIHPQEEDFGIAQVEAMAGGTPVIAYNAGGVRETVSHGVNGYLFEEQTWQSLADAVIRSRRISFDANHIRFHAAQFSEERFAREIETFVLLKHAQAHRT